jgi:hypothetical protein
VLENLNLSMERPDPGTQLEHHTLELCLNHLLIICLVANDLRKLLLRSTKVWIYFMPSGEATRRVSESKIHLLAPMAGR